ncbi:hypothetical protein LIZ77_09625 [Clostridium perfringens]|uniref:TIGR04104 family putative zinc finger protein n=1 Tax=Clostridium perfringens TaxID=1502 RepID=UPI000BBB1B31|nr:TIGR04104 family putative zinc finger protein [Clostridium perfringens]MDU7884688.1 hypothetical protein [Klebsiella michiganensis]EHK2327609.1 hypothetical protein [Clostridium perfringens]MBS5968427.1 hypothetical protein [Clostridium perfringens]MCX0371030.1 hypothetical protein [Clostridium perfringens]MDK0862490.1 hypothetical protein [Clostridium perfringens]
MKVCSNCKESFSYVDLMVALWKFSGYGYIKCKNCNTQYKITKNSKALIALLVLFPYFIEGYVFSFDIFYYIIYLIIIIPLSPFMIKLKENNDNEKYIKL